MTKVAWHMKKDELRKADPAISRKRFIYNLSRASYKREWPEEYQRPGCFARFLGFLLRIVPKAGPFRALAFKTPTPAVENLFMVSFDTSLDRYRALLRQSGSSNFHLPNRNFDTGQPVVAGKYKLADKTFAELVGKLAGKNFGEVTPELKKSILSFYSDPGAPVATRSNPGDWRKLQDELTALRSLADSGESKPAR
jgi:hypothetical protein